MQVQFILLGCFGNSKVKSLSIKNVLQIVIYPLNELETALRSPKKKINENCNFNNAAQLLLVLEVS